MTKSKIKIVRITTVPVSLRILLKGQLKFMSNYFDVIAISSRGNDLDLINNQNIHVYNINLIRGISPFQDIKAIIKLVLILSKELPQVIHTHTPKAGFIGMTAAWISRVPIKIHTVAGLPLMEANGIKKKILIIVEKLTYFFADKIYPNSYELKNYIKENKFCKKEKLKVIGNGSSNGIDTEYFSNISVVKEDSISIKNKLGINENNFVFIFIGRIVNDKGINELLEVFDQLSKENPLLKLLLVGPFEKDLDPITQSSKNILINNKNVIHVGFQEDVRPYILLSDVLVFPSYREGFPNVPMQAGAMGLPSIVTNINGCNEIIINEKNGLIIPPKSKEELKNAMIRIYSDEELRRILASNAREMIVNRFDQMYFWNELLKEYRSLLQLKGISKK